MFITPTLEQFDILNAILPKINPEASFFNIPSLYAPILKEKYPVTVNGIRTGDYDRALTDLSTRKVFENATNWFLQNQFAEKVMPPSSIYIDLKLTGLGEILWAYGNIYEYLVACETTSVDAIEERIPLLIGKAFPYGEFIIKPEIVNPRFVNINFLSPNDEEELAKIQKALDPKEQTKILHRQSVLDEEVMQYLVNNGFAINRHDIKVEGVIYRQLTDKGRELKECGSLEAYNKLVEERKLNMIEIEKNRQRENQRNELQFEMNERQEKLTHRQLFVNICIAVATVAAAVYYVFGLFDFYDKHSVNWTYAAYFLSGFGLAGLILLIRWLLRKK